MLKYCRHRQKTKEICDKAVDTFMSALKFVPDQFVMNKVIEKLDNAVFSNNDIVSGDIDSEI